MAREQRRECLCYEERGYWQPTKERLGMVEGRVPRGTTL